MALPMASVNAPVAQTPVDALVLFGASGDLARKRLFPALYRLTRRGRLNIPVIGVARSEWSDDQLHEYARSAIADQVGGPDDRPSVSWRVRLPISAATTAILGSTNIREAGGPLSTALGASRRSVLEIKILG